MNGLLQEAAFHPSPNCDERPEGIAIDLIVIHNISLPPGEFGGEWMTDLFLNRLDPQIHPYFRGIAQMRVSSHLLIRRTGKLIQYVPLQLRAWHAGDSSFKERRVCNDFSIGIELEGTDDTAYPDEQYSRLIDVTREIIQSYPLITPNRIVGHCDIAPRRKSDPGPLFDWQRYQSELSTAL